VAAIPAGLQFFCVRAGQVLTVGDEVRGDSGPTAVTCPWARGSSSRPC